MDAVTVTSLARFAPYLITLLFGGCLFGCASLNPQPPIEAFATKLADQAIIPAVKEGLSQGVEHLTIQAGAQGINPTYVVNFEGKWVVGIEGRASVGVEGVAGQLQISSVSSEETETSPHAKDNAGDGAKPSDAVDNQADRPAPQPSAAQPQAPATRPSTISLHIYDVDRDENKGFSRLDDGTLVVVLGAADKLGQTVIAEVTGAAATPGGRLITAKLVGGP